VLRDTSADVGALPVPPVSSYLSIVAIYRDEAVYLREWIEFHRMVGVERFFLYDNFSVDDHRAVLAPYVDAGTVVIHDWPVFPGQLPAYDDALGRHGRESRWIAFIDLDEFLFSPTGESLPTVLRDYEQHPGVLANWAIFGSSGHQTRPSGLVIENYVRRAPPDEGPQQSKTILDPARAERCGGAHWFHYKQGSAVDELHRPVPYGRTASLAFDRLRVNHYYSKSIEEGKQKLARRAPTTGDLRTAALNRLEHVDQIMNRVPDEAITSYLPELRRRLGLAVEAQPESSN
jgi:glycosyl transferase family 92